MPGAKARRMGGLALKLRYAQLRQAWRRRPPGQGPGQGKIAEPHASTEVAWAQAVELARREWIACRAYFDCVSDPELVDHAIYAVQAAERKYMYLLRKAKLAAVALDRPSGPDEAESWQSLWDDPAPAEEAPRGH